MYLWVTVQHSRLEVCCQERRGLPADGSPRILPYGVPPRYKGTYFQTTRLKDPVFFDTPVLIKERVPSLGLHFPPIYPQPYINTSTSAPTEYRICIHDSPTFSRGGDSGNLNRTPNTCICTTNCHDFRPHEFTLIQVYNSTDFPQLSETRYRQPQARTPRHIHDAQTKEITGCAVAAYSEQLLRHTTRRH